MTGNLFALFESRFPADRRAVFIDSPTRGVFSYADLAAWSDRFAQFLRAGGAVPGDRIAVQVDKSPEAIFLYLACLKAGLVYLPLNTGYEAAEVRYFVADAEPRLFVTSDAARPKIAGAVGGTPVHTLNADGTGTLIDASAGCGGGASDIHPVAGRDLASIIYTSGTTGKPKGAMLSHDNLSSNALTLHDIWGFVPGDVLLHALPIYHVHGLFVATHCALLNGSGMIFHDSFSASEVIDALSRATVMMGVPTFYTRLLGEARFTAAACQDIRLFISGSAPLLPETFDAFQARTGHTILERYGMTEAGMIASNPLEGARLAGTVGYALSDVRVRVVGDDGRALEPGAVGGLEVAGPNLFKGYWRMPEKTAEDMSSDGYFRTGDMATMSDDGRVSLVGRAKDLIISGGLNIYPKEIEAEIDAVPGVGESAVIGVPHGDFGEAVVAVVTRVDAGIDEAAVLGALDGRLARFKRPKRVFFVDTLPRNAMGKVTKKTLRDTYGGTFSGGSTGA
ncbi:MAG: AMP-binding protein [Proteobacteria bacterium]|nr:AMP-binding protein [Pseudomonadota bacterium]